MATTEEKATRPEEGKASKVKSAWSWSIKKVKSGAKRAWDRTKKIGKGTGHVVAVSAQAAVYAVQWTLAAIAVAVFYVISFLLTVLAMLFTAVVIGVFVIGMVCIFILAYAQYGVDKYLVGPCRWAMLRPAVRKAEKKRGNGFTVFVNDRIESFGSHDSAHWASRMYGWLSNDVLAEEAGRPVDDTTVPVDDRPFTPGPFRTNDFSEHPDPEQRATFFRYTRRNEELMEADAAFNDRVEMIIEADMEDPETSFPGVDAYTVYESTGPMVQLEVPDYDKYLEGVRDLRDQDFSKFDNGAELLEFYGYMQDLCRTGHDLRMASYWEGRAQMLNAYMQNPDVIDRSGRQWAIINQHFTTKQDQFSIRYLRTGFVEEEKSLHLKRNRQMSERPGARQAADSTT